VKEYNYITAQLVIFLRTVAQECDRRSVEGQWSVNADLLREAAVKLEAPKSKEKYMSDTQKTLAKGIIVGTVVKRQPNMIKAYVALAAAAVYGIRAAREARTDLNEVVEKLDFERKRPVVVVEPIE
jgi:hypothetical protein